jgi:hypothetical protein
MSGPLSPLALLHVLQAACFLPPLQVSLQQLLCRFEELMYLGGPLWQAWFLHVGIPTSCKHWMAQKWQQRWEILPEREQQTEDVGDGEMEVSRGPEMEI